MKGIVVYDTSYGNTKQIAETISEIWMNKPFATFDTENPENMERARIENKELSAAEKIAERLRDKKLYQLLPVLKAAVLDWKGPLQEGEIERTKDYARKLTKN
jgi:flavodoxin